MEVDGVGGGKDFRLYPGGGDAWDWSLTGTQHSPGIQPADVEDLLARGATVLVLSRGMRLRLEVDPRTMALIEERGIIVHMAETTDAVAIYNELAEAQPIGE